MLDTFIEDTVSGENMVEIEIAKHRVTANYKTNISAESFSFLVLTWVR